MKAGQVIHWLSQLDPNEYVAVIWWTRDSVKASLNIEELDPKDWRHIVHEFDDETLPQVEELSSSLDQIAREVLNI